MKKEPFIIERIYNASSASVWKAITDRDQMKQWYFDLTDFKPQVGFEFTFEAKNEGRTFKHLCKVTEVVPGKRLAYSWRYEGFEGDSVVTFELSGEGDKTRLRLTHEGLGTFPANNADFARENFVAGWTSLIGTNLKGFVEKSVVKH
ncbi:MAG TPA: SRPBCC domain-containing protein [Puia sp.]|nr:SRPBCC domain-containing protein [Puia sp.]